MFSKTSYNRLQCEIGVFRFKSCIVKYVLVNLFSVCVCLWSQTTLKTLGQGLPKIKLNKIKKYVNKNRNKKKNKETNSFLGVRPWNWKTGLGGVPLYTIQIVFLLQCQGQTPYITLRHLGYSPGMLYRVNFLGLPTFCLLFFLGEKFWYNKKSTFN